MNNESIIATENEKENNGNHVFLKGRATLKYRKGYRFQGFRPMDVRTGNALKTSKIIGIHIKSMKTIQKPYSEK